MLSRRRARAAIAAVSALGAAGAIALAGGGAGAQSPAAGDGEHLLIAPDTAAARAALAGSSAQVIARYESFTLVEASGADVTRLVDAGADVRDDMREVRIGERRVDPARERPRLAGKGGAGIRAAGEGARGLAVVQFVGPIKDGWLDRIRESGVKVVTYMAQNGQLVAGTDAELRKLAAQAGKDPAVRAVTPYTADDKRAPRLARAGAGDVKVTVSTVAGDDGDAARRAVAAAGRPDGDPVTIGEITQRRYTVPAARVDALARDGGVVAVEPFAEPKLLDERAAQIVAGNVNASHQPTGPGYRAWLTSKGFPTTSAIVVDITDEGVDKGVVPPPAGSHRDFYLNGNTANPSRIVYAQESTATDTDAKDCGGHGTNVASIATGHNTVVDPGTTWEDAQNYNFGMGVAPYVKLGATKIFECATGLYSVTTSLTALHGNAYANGARISNNSWGADTEGEYTADSREVDAIVRDARPAVAGNQQITEVFAAGNAGPQPDTVGAPATGKNVIAVGATESVRAIGTEDGCGVPDTGANSARDVIDFSSRGPTADGRTKPDIVAPGTHVVGAKPQVGAFFSGSGVCDKSFPFGSDSTLYTLVSGTSQATPEVTGAAANVRNWFYRTRAGAYPSPAMTKALLVNTATDIAGGQDGVGGTHPNVPTPVQGWGRVNLGTLVDGTQRRTVDQSQVFTATGGTRRTYYSVPDASRPLKVTLAYTDAPGPTTGDSFVNDLDLEVSVSGRPVYKGNVLSNGFSVGGGSADPRNNLENVFVPAGVGGPVEVRVVARNIAGDGVPGNADATDQDYALVVSNAAPATKPVIVSEDRTVVDRSTDKDGHLEPGEQFGFKQELRNRGNAGATGISGTLASLDPTASITQGSSTWPNLPVGAAAFSASELRGTLAAGHRCGAQVNLELSLQSSGGPVKVPLTLETSGPPSAQIATTSGYVPRTIPDGNLAGVTSAHVLPASAGAIADMNVRIGKVTHSYVSDLVIMIRTPWGATVTLFNQRGDDGENLENTVFDDEAAVHIANGEAPYTGSFRPEQPLTSFKGRDASGTWTLKLIDVYDVDEGTLNGWGLNRRDMVCAA